MPDELVIVHKEMHDLACWVLYRVVVVDGDKFALRISLNRFELRNAVLANARKHELVQIFKVEHTSPQ